MVKQAKGACYVLGVGMTKFVKPRGKIGYEELVSRAEILQLHQHT